MSSCTTPKRPADQPAIYNAIVPPMGGLHPTLIVMAVHHQVQAEW